MESCKICKTEFEETLSVCTVCKYPLQGTDQQKARYVARYAIQKNDVLFSFKRLKHARIIIFVLGAFFILPPLVMEIGGIELAINIVIGLVFIGCGFLSFKKPKIAILIPLCLVILNYVILFLIDPMLVWSGVIWKILILIGLGYGYYSVYQSDKTLKENPYLASVLGFDKMT